MSPPLNSTQKNNPFLLRTRYKNSPLLKVTKENLKIILGQKIHFTGLSSKETILHDIPLIFIRSWFLLISPLNTKNQIRFVMLRENKPCRSHGGMFKRDLRNQWNPFTRTIIHNQF